MKAPFGGSSGNLHADRRYGLALQLNEWGDIDAAIDLLMDTVPLAPSWPPFYFYLGDFLKTKNDFESAEKYFRQYLDLDPSDMMGAGIKLSLMQREDKQSALSKAYVESLFDQYAPHFETSLLDNLNYQTPKQIADFLPKKFYDDVLDLGCGTGLMGLELKDRVKVMTGVDLSSRMIEQAKLKNIYRNLVVSDLEDFLKNNGDVFDLVIAADVFVYIGELKDIFKNVKKCLKPQGQFVFSVQDTQHDDWILGQDHRYAHSSKYIKEIAHAAEMTPAFGEILSLRHDRGAPISGRIILCKNF